MTAFATVLMSPMESVDEVLARVGARFGVTPVEIRSRDRHRRLSQARQVAAWILRRRGRSLEEVGMALCRDHTTIITAVRKVEREIELSPEVRASLQELLTP